MTIWNKSLTDARMRLLFKSYYSYDSRLQWTQCSWYFIKEMLCQCSPGAKSVIYDCLFTLKYYDEYAFVLVCLFVWLEALIDDAIYLKSKRLSFVFTVDTTSIVNSVVWRSFVAILNVCHDFVSAMSPILMFSVVKLPAVKQRTYKTVFKLCLLFREHLVKNT